MKSTTFDLFTLNHLILWIIIGYLFPNRYYLACTEWRVFPHLIAVLALLT